MNNEQLRVRARKMRMHYTIDIEAEKTIATAPQLTMSNKQLTMNN